MPLGQEWKLALDPEDLEEIAFAVLRHYASAVAWGEIDAAVRAQPAALKRDAEELSASYRDAAQRAASDGKPQPSC